MELRTFKYLQDQGWSCENFPNLDSENTLIIVFANPLFAENRKPLYELSQYYHKAKIIGCSTAGEISGASILDDSLSVAIVRFEKTKINAIQLNISDFKDSFLIGKNISEHLNANDLRSIFVLGDGLSINGSDLATGLNSAVAENVVITGGLAGDGIQFQKTWILFAGEILYKSIVAVGFYGENIHCGYGCRAGWDIFGPERRITNSKNNILYELDSQPALSLYKEYLGEKAKDLPSAALLYPLAIRQNIDDKRQLIRSVIGVDEQTQSLLFAGDIPLGYLAQLMRANLDRLIQRAGDAGECALKTLLLGLKKIDNQPILAIAISCVGRRLVLGSRTDEETEVVLEMLPSQTQLIGFYSYGELAPCDMGKCNFHNQTMTLTVFCEDR